MKEWLFNEEKRDVFFAILSALALILSLTHALKDFLPFDIAWVAIVLCGTPIVMGSIVALVKDHDIKADLLVSIALIASLYVGEYFAAGEAALIMAIGSILEDFTSMRARSGIEKLIKLTPKTARVKKAGTEVIIPADEVKVGDILVVLAGETIPTDGIIISGTTSIDQSVMTGESIPVDKTVGDEVMGGTLNQFGTFEMQATKVGSNSTLQRIIRLAREADANKAPIVRLADRWANWLVLVALGIAIITGIVTGELIRAVTVLVVFCPCAFILATPTAVIASIGNLTRYGVLVRSGESLQRFSQIDYVGFDKTGTLTYGKPTVIEIESFNPNITKDELLRLTALAEGHSEHPLGKAINSYYLAMGGIIRETSDFTLKPGMGVSAKVDDHTILAGKIDYLKNGKIAISDEVIKVANNYSNRGATIVYVGIDGEFVGFLALADVLRSSAKELISQLKSLGAQPMLLTGDNEVTAKYIASLVGIDDVRPNLLPEEKMEIIKAYTDSGKNICMIGDGVNDVLALKSAKASIAMGGIGSDIAIEASDAVLVSDNIEEVPHLFKMAQKTMLRINFNITFAMIWNFIAVTLSALGVLNPVTGALVHNVGSVFVVISSALLIGEKQKTVH